MEDVCPNVNTLLCEMQGRGRGGGRQGAAAANSAPIHVDNAMGLMRSPFPPTPNGAAAMANYNSYQYVGGMRSLAMQPVGGMHSPMAVEAGYTYNPHVVYQSTFTYDGATNLHTPLAAGGFRVPATPTWLRTQKKSHAPETLDLEVSHPLSQNAKRAHNRRLHA